MNTSRRRWLARLLSPVAVLTVLLVSVPAAAAAEPVLVIDGRGWGHGVGMSQEGARTMAAQGASTDQILSTFYPGTVRGSSKATVRVVVLESPAQSETLVFPGGGEVRASPSGRQPPGFPVAVGPGGAVTVTHDGGGYHAAVAVHGVDLAALSPTRLRLIADEVGAGTTSSLVTLPANTGTVATTKPATVGLPPPSTLGSTAGQTSSTTLAMTSTTVAPRPLSEAAPPAAPPPSPSVAPRDLPPSAALPLWAVPAAGGTTTVTSRGQTYRGTVEIGNGDTGKLRLVNQLDVESYLRGMGEIRDASWPAAALRAQAVAARTYAARAAMGGVDLCDDDHCQVYLGEQAEYPAMDEAVADTRGQVLMYGGSLAATYYSANAGGVSATPEEGFGAGWMAAPYLVSAPYPSSDPYPWTVRASLADVGRRLAYPASLGIVRVTSTGPSGRATQITLDGDAGPVVIDGPTFASRLGLNSTLFTAHIETGAAPPLPADEASNPDASPQSSALIPANLGPSLAVESAAPAPPSRSPLRRYAPGLLALLLADTTLIALRARRRRVGATGR